MQLLFIGFYMNGDGIISVIIANILSQNEICKVVRLEYYLNRCFPKYELLYTKSSTLRSNQ